MKFQWIIEEADVERIKRFINGSKDDAFVKERMSCNLASDKPPATREDFWDNMIGCLLTTQQRSGPKSNVSRFLSKPFRLRLELCEPQADLTEFVRTTLTEFGGIRFTNKIGGQVEKNLHLVQGEHWSECVTHLDAVRRDGTIATERRAANFVEEHFAGFGPKQSRNLLQSLGLTRYVLALDSRLTKWFNKFGFPIRLSATLLSESAYYEFIEDAVQELCKRCDIYPCLLDAAIFASFDEGGWETEDVLW
jgi:hypothetical protein